MAKICIDPGHFGKYNQSPAVPEYYESEAMWKLSQLQKKYLEEMGHTVVMTRSNANKDLALDSRGKKSKGCDLFISNHSNAVGNMVNETVNYVSVYHLTDDDTTKCDDLSKVYAEALAPVIGEVLGERYKILTRKSANDRNKDGKMNDNYYGVLNGSRSVETPGLILEHGFHTNTKNSKWLLDEDNLALLARTEATTINEILSTKVEEPKKEDPVVEKKPDELKVRVSITNLNIRKGPGTNFDKEKKPIEPGVYTIVEVQKGTGSKAGWGKLKSGKGWISLDFVEASFK